MNAWKPYNRLNIDLFDLPDRQDYNKSRQAFHHKNHGADNWHDETKEIISTEYDTELR